MRRRLPRFPRPQLLRWGTAHLPLGELIDLEKERQRLDKEVQKVQSEIKRSRGEIGQPRFCQQGAGRCCGGRTA